MVNSQRPCDLILLASIFGSPPSLWRHPMRGRDAESRCQDKVNGILTWWDMYGPYGIVWICITVWVCLDMYIHISTRQKDAYGVSQVCSCLYSQFLWWRQRNENLATSLAPWNAPKRVHEALWLWERCAYAKTKGGRKSCQWCFLQHLRL
jgi:hypothetical protein